MKKLILLLALLIVLVIVSAGFVSGALDPTPDGGCYCTDDGDGGMWASWNDCDSCGYATCIGNEGLCDCTPTSDFSSAACNSPLCSHYFNEYGNHAYWVASTSVYNAGDGTGTGYCCGNEAGEKYVYSGVQGCCDDLDDCATSTGLCVTTGNLDPSQTRVCRDATGQARDDWYTCSSSSFANQFYTAGGKEYMCVNSGGWKWVLPAYCSYSNAVCTGGSCGGQWTYDDICCTGALLYDIERVGYVAGQSCGTLDGWCDGSCFCGVDV